MAMQPKEIMQRMELKFNVRVSKENRDARLENRDLPYYKFLLHEITRH